MAVSAHVHMARFRTSSGLTGEVLIRGHMRPSGQWQSPAEAVAASVIPHSRAGSAGTGYECSHLYLKVEIGLSVDAEAGGNLAEIETGGLHISINELPSGNSCRQQQNPDADA